MKRIQTFLVSSALACSVAIVPLQAQAQSNASQMSGYALFSVAAGSVILASQAGNAVKDAGQFLSQQVGMVVRGVSQAGQFSVLAVHNASGALVGTVSIAAGSVAAGSIAVGQSVVTVVEASGTALYAGSHLIAFIPNEMAKQLMYHEKIKG